MFYLVIKVLYNLDINRNIKQLWKSEVQRLKQQASKLMECPPHFIFSCVIDQERYLDVESNIKNTYAANDF